MLQTGEREERELMHVPEIKNIVANHRIIFENYRNLGLPENDKRL